MSLSSPYLVPTTEPYTIPPDLLVPFHIQQTLRRAHDLLAEKGWCQRRFVDEDGRRCLVEAVLEVDRDLGPHNSFALRFIEHAVLHNSAIAWNDVQGRTQAQVLSLLEELYA